MLGTRLMILAGLIGAAISIYYYFAPGIGLDGEAGVLLVIISSLLMVVGSLVLLKVSGVLAGVFSVLLLLDIIGTSVAAYFLETPILIAAMALALVGWLMRTMSNAANSSVEVA